MRLLSVPLFFTLVGSLWTSAPAFAAPTTDSTRPKFRAEPRRSDPRPTPEKTESVRWAEPPPSFETPDPRRDEIPRSHGDRLKSWSAIGSFANGAFLKKGETRSVFLVGLQKHLPARDLASWDFAVSAGTDSWIQLALYRRQQLDLDFPFKPYWRAGLTQALSGEGMPASLVDLERVKVAGSVGFFDILDSSPSQVGFDLGVAWGRNGLALQATAAWGFDF